MLVDTNVPAFRLSLSMVVAMTLVVGNFLLLVLSMLIYDLGCRINFPVPQYGVSVADTLKAVDYLFRANVDPANVAAIIIPCARRHRARDGPSWKADPCKLMNPRIIIMTSSWWERAAQGCGLRSAPPRAA
jgi:hypothetical protein